MTKLILIRHGESSFNLVKRYTGQTDVPLTELGQKQAEITAQYILSNYKIDTIYSSDLSRAVKTAEPIANALNLEIKTDKRLREIFAGDWQGLYFSEVAKKYKEEYELYKKDRYLGRTSNGESMTDVLDRVYEALLEIAKENDGKCVLVSTHNGPIMAIQAPILNISLNDVKSLSNNSVTEVDYENGEFKMITLGYDAHLGEYVTSFGKNKTAN